MTKALKWQIACALLLVFLAGIAVGAFGTVHHIRMAFLAHSPGRFRERMSEHLRRELQLTPEQFEKVRPVTDRAADQLEQIRTETGRRVEETMRRTHEEIAPLLTPEQQKKLDEMAERHRRMHHHGPPPPP